MTGPDDELPELRLTGAWMGPDPAKEVFWDKTLVEDSWLQGRCRADLAQLRLMGMADPHGGQFTWLAGVRSVQNHPCAYTPR